MATINHIDTCLPCYLTQGGLILCAPVDGNTTYGEVLGELLSDLQGSDMGQWDAPFVGVDWEAVVKAWFDDVDLSHKFDSSLDCYLEDDDGSDMVYAYFELSA